MMPKVGMKDQSKVSFVNLKPLKILHYKISLKHQAVCAYKVILHFDWENFDKKYLYANKGWRSNTI
jgi:hypothetical protein